MNLRPMISVRTASYPTYDGFRRTKRWLKKAATVGAASLALLAGGCERCSSEEAPVEDPGEMMRPGGIPYRPLDAGGHPPHTTSDSSTDSEQPTPADGEAGATEDAETGQDADSSQAQQPDASPPRHPVRPGGVIRRPRPPDPSE